MNFKKYHVSRNLLPSPVSATVESAGITIESTGDGTINASGTRTSGDSPTINLKEAVTLNGTYYVHLRNNVAAPSSTIVLRNGTTSIVNITLTSTNLITQITLSNVTIDNIQVYVTPGTSINAQMAISIEQTESVIPYEPYSSEVWHDTPHYIHNTSTDTITTPADIYADGNNATVGLKGNTVQSGTPTPENPIMPQECGERTGNLIDKTGFTDIGATIEQIEDGIRIITQSGGYAARIVLDVLQNTDYTVSYIYKKISGSGTNVVRVFAGTGSSTEIASFVDKTGGTFNSGNNTKINIWFYAAFGVAATVEYTKIMLNAGSTALPYEPYGYKIPILSNSTTTPVYLGEVETTRRVEKLVLDGTETWSLWPSGQPDVERYYYKWGKVTPSDYGLICTHFPFRTSDGNYEHVRAGGSSREDFIVFISRTIATTVADFTAWLAAQYAAGTPVCVWYVLANEQTGIVNEPLRKIGNYADTVSGITISTIAGADSFDVLTTFKPSEVTVNYKGWHNVEVKEKSGNYLDENDFGLVEVAAGVYRTGTDVGILPSGTYTLSANKSSTAVQIYRTVKNGSTYNYETISELPYTFTADGVSNQIFRTAGSTETSWADSGYSNVMLNTGETAQTYEPYWK